jgi:hypothetical protein
MYPNRMDAVVVVGIGYIRGRTFNTLVCVELPVLSLAVVVPGVDIECA